MLSLLTDRDGKYHNILENMIFSTDNVECVHNILILAELPEVHAGILVNVGMHRSTSTTSTSTASVTLVQQMGALSTDMAIYKTHIT